LDQLKSEYQEKTDVIFLLPEIKLRLKNQEQVSEIVEEIVAKKLGKNAKYEVVDLSTVSFESLVSKLSYAKLLIGMTGSEMISALFLPKNSAVVELFPYGLGPDVSSFIQVQIGFCKFFLSPFNLKFLTTTDCLSKPGSQKSLNCH